MYDQTPMKLSPILRTRLDKKVYSLLTHFAEGTDLIGPRLIDLQGPINLGIITIRILARLCNIIKICDSNPVIRPLFL